MKRQILLSLLTFFSMALSAQTDITKIETPLPVWIYFKDSAVQKAVLTGGNSESLTVYPGSMKEYKKESSPESINIDYKKISMIKVKKKGGLLKGLLIGGGIGAAPLIFGEGGAYVALVSFPVGVITGGIVGATSKKKFTINSDLTAFRKFTGRFIK